MFKSFYELKITGKDVKRFIKKLFNQKIYIENIEIYDKYAYIKVSKDNYEKVKKIKTIYDIKIIKLYGIIKLIDILKRHYIFIVAFIVGYCYLILLSNIIFKIEVIHSKKEIRDLLYNELKKHGIKKYTFVKNYKNKEKILKEILDNNKDKIEWLEINRIGSTYEVRVEERIIKKKKKETNKRNIIAKKAGIISKIEASNGEIKRKKGDYVKKGDIIVSGIITKNDSIKNTVSAEGKIYAEVWYKTNVDMPFYYKEINYTNEKSKKIKIKFLDKDFYLFNLNKYKTYKEKNIFSINNNLIPIKLMFCSEQKTIEIDKLYSVEEAIKEAEKKSKIKIKESLKNDEYIIKEKVINSTEYEDHINIEIFYKVCEDITDYEDITDDYLEKFKKQLEESKE